MKVFLPLFIGFDILLFDLLSKYLVTIKLKEPLEIFSGIFFIELHKNPGLAFSIPLPTTLQIIFSLILLVIIFTYFKQRKISIFESVCLASIFSGAVGNLIERILFGSVTDFLAIWKFPIFNVADIAISLGVIGLIFFETQQHQKKS